MAKIGTVQNKKPSAPSTSGFPKAVQSKKVSNKATVPATMKNGGKMGKKGC